MKTGQAFARDDDDAEAYYSCAGVDSRFITLPPLLRYPRDIKAQLLVTGTRRLGGIVPKYRGQLENATTIIKEGKKRRNADRNYCNRYTTRAEVSEKWIFKVPGKKWSLTNLNSFRSQAKLIRCAIIVFSLIQPIFPLLSHFSA